eukprot:3430011-Rhodomonas_salina.1
MLVPDLPPALHSKKPQSQYNLYHKSLFLELISRRTPVAPHFPTFYLVLRDPATYDVPLSYRDNLLLTQDTLLPEELWRSKQPDPAAYHRFEVSTRYAHLRTAHWYQQMHTSAFVSVW